MVLKLVAIGWLSLGVAFFFAWQGMERFTANYFMNLMNQYNIGPNVLYTTFLKANRQYLLFSMFLGLLVASLFSFFIIRKLLRTLTDMVAVTQKLSVGDYSERVKVETSDEVGVLGRAFNQMVERLETTEKMRKDLVANVAHELRTPLNNIQGHLEAMQDNLMLLSQETLLSLHNETLRLVRLVDALHRLTQIDSKTHFLQKERCHLDHFIQGILQKKKGEIARKGIVFTFHPQSISLIVDPDGIAQVIGNLLQNMVQYTPHGGTARLSIEMEGNFARVVFVNSGEGISPEDLPQIFERFYRCEKSRSHETGGAGIGLAIVKQIVEAHGGHVGAKSDLGETSVWITLPLA